MITNELESELRRTFARAAADFDNAEQARQRLLQRDYHPRRRNRRLAAGRAAAAIAAGIAVPLAAGGGSRPAAAGPVIQLGRGPGVCSCGLRGFGRGRLLGWLARARA